MKHNSWSFLTRPRVLPIPGVELENVFTLRTPDDANKIAENIPGKNVVIIGSSFIGQYKPTCSYTSLCTCIHLVNKNFLNMFMNLAESGIIVLQKVLVIIDYTKFCEIVSRNSYGEGDTVLLFYMSLSWIFHFYVQYALDSVQYVENIAWFHIYCWVTARFSVTGWPTGDLNCNFCTIAKCLSDSYSRTSVAPTLMARPPWLFRTRSWIPRKNPLAADLG